MTQIPFRHHHLLSMLEAYDQERGPLDRWMALYFRSNRSLGSKDRAFIAETAYTMLRWQRLLDTLSNSTECWETRLKTLIDIDIKKECQNQALPPHTRCSCPEELFNILTENYGEEKAIELALSSNEPAPTTIRVNRIKTTRDTLIESWQNRYAIRPCLKSPDGIVFEKKINFYELPEFKKGLFSIQDEASQLVSDLVEAKPGDQVLDFCAGSGGKSLAFAHKMQGKGQLYLHDIRERALLEAKQRLSKAGIQNCQTLLPSSPLVSKLKKKCDWVIVDAPCSGTGTLRRNPDMKWRFSPQMVERLLGQQRQIFEQALSFLKSEGTIIYATCSILKQENQAQVDHFVKTYNLKIVDPVFESFPAKGEMDGFFAARMRR